MRLSIYVPKAKIAFSIFVITWSAGANITSPSWLVIWLRVRKKPIQIGDEIRVEIVHGGSSRDHVHIHMFVSVPLNLRGSHLMRKMGQWSSHKVWSSQLKKATAGGTLGP
jgi:REP element-mobilizing transposase RayT